MHAQPAPSPVMAPRLVGEIQGEDEAGRMVKLHELGGRFVIVEVWAPWAPVCQRASHQIMGLTRKLWRRGHPTYWVRYALESDRRRWREFARSFPYDVPWILNWRDPLGHLSPMFDRMTIETLPYLMIFSPEGELIYHGSNIPEARTITLSAARRIRRAR